MSLIPFPEMPRNLVAILRGIRPDETEACVGALIARGLTAIEIPLNSPEPFRSIETAAKLAPEGTLIGAGTVLDSDDVDRLHGAGGRLLVAPNVEPAVLERAHRFGMVTMPGVFTATEALLAARCGASALKFFPASALGPAGIAAIRAVLPKDALLAAVGGVSHDDFPRYFAAGIRTFGMASSLYRPGMSASELGERARITVEAYDAAAAA